MSDDQEVKLAKAHRIINSAYSKKTNVLRYFGLSSSSAELLEKGIEMLKEISGEYKITRKYSKYVDISIKIVDLYDKLFDTTKCNSVRKYQAMILIDLIEHHIKHNPSICLYDLSKKYIETSRESFDEYLLTNAYNQIGNIYIESSDEKEQSLAFECFTELSEMSGVISQKLVYMIAKHKKNYIDAGNKYKLIGNDMITKKSGKWTMKTILLKSILCYICGDDIVLAKQTFKYINDTNVFFSRSNESKLLRDIFNCLEKNDVNKFTEIITEYDVVFQLDDHLVDLLLTIKKNLEKNTQLGELYCDELYCDELYCDELYCDELC